MRAPRGSAAGVWLRCIEDGEPTIVEAVVDEDDGVDTWWRADFAVPNATARYRWLIDGGEFGYRWLNGIGSHAHDVAIVRGNDDLPGARVDGDVAHVHDLAAAGVAAEHEVAWP